MQQLKMAIPHYILQHVKIKSILLQHCWNMRPIQMPNQ
ncbi:hypothetical protein BLA29_014948, partial [Euroglyphus maynei]